MLGQRLREARVAAGLSLDDLAGRLERPISKQALSKYERGASQPPPRRLSEIAAALNVRTSALLTEPAVDIRWEAFRKLAKLSKARQERVTAVAAQRLESEFRLRAMFHFDERHDLPGPIAVRNLADCDYAAATLRMRWNLGDRPVDNLIGLIEERGGAVLTWPEAWGFDGLSGWAGSTPVLVLDAQAPPDRLRFNAAHELGHLVMKSSGDAKQDERFAHRFAASFLVPAEAARRELGVRRRNLSIDELGLLKQRWGLSMQGWIRRARDLEIISDDLYRALNVQFRRRGWHREEPVPYTASESPSLFRRLVLRAHAEGAITSAEAERLSPGASETGEHPRVGETSLRDLARRPGGERHAVVREAAIEVDADETDRWDAVAADDLD